MSKWIRKGDRVVVTAGNDKGKVGTVLSRGLKRVLVQGINIRKKHMKRQQEAQPAQIVDMEVPIHISNVRICSEDGKPVKIRVKVNSDGNKELVYRLDGNEKVYRSVKKHIG